MLGHPIALFGVTELLAEEFFDFAGSIGVDETNSSAATSQIWPRTLPEPRDFLTGLPRLFTMTTPLCLPFARASKLTEAILHTWNVKRVKVELRHQKVCVKFVADAA